MNSSAAAPSAPSPKKAKLFAAILRIKKICEDSKNADTICQYTLERLRALVIVLQQPQSQSIYSDTLECLEKLKGKMKQLSRMNRIYYLAQAIQLHTEIFERWNNLSKSLMPLAQGLNEISSEQQQQQQLPEPEAALQPLRQALARYFDISERQDSSLAQFQQAVKEEQTKLASAPDFSTAVQEVMGDPIQDIEWHEALRLLQQQVEIVTSQLSSPSFSADPMARSQALQCQEFLNTMVEQVTKSMPPTEEPIFPAWALDPITQKVMTEPVNVRAACNHTLNKSSFETWLEKGNKTCPVCGVTLKALYATPNRDLLLQIQALSDTNGVLGDSTSFNESFASLNSDWRTLLGLREGSRGSVYFREEGGNDDVSTVGASNGTQRASISNASNPSSLDANSYHSQRSKRISGGMKPNSEHSRATTEGGYASHLLQSSSTHRSSLGGNSTHSTSASRSNRSKKSDDPLGGRSSTHSTTTRISSSGSAVKSVITLGDSSSAHQRRPTMAKSLSTKMGKLLKTNDKIIPRSKSARHLKS